jgi:hypothetical protein
VKLRRNELSTCVNGRLQFVGNRARVIFADGYTEKEAESEIHRIRTGLTTKEGRVAVDEIDHVVFAVAAVLRTCVQCRIHTFCAHV